MRLSLFSLCLLLIVGCSKVYQVHEISGGENNQRFENVESNVLVNSEIEPYKASLEGKMNANIGEVAKNLEKAKPESTLGNLLSDATRIMASEYLGKSVDIGIMNYGGIRLPSLNKGELSLGTVYELMPFDNFVVVLTLNGEELEAFLNLVAARGGWPISGASFKINNDEAIEILINREPLNSSRNYTIALSDYIANGGDKMAMLKELPRENTGKLLRDAFIEYFTQVNEQGNLIDANIEGRVNNE